MIRLRSKSSHSKGKNEMDIRVPKLSYSMLLVGAIFTHGCKQSKGPSEVLQTASAPPGTAGCEVLRAKKNYIIPVYAAENLEVSYSEKIARTDKEGKGIYAITLENKGNLVGVKVYGDSVLNDGKVYYIDRNSQNFECLTPNAINNRTFLQGLLKTDGMVITSQKSSLISAQDTIANNSGYVLCEGSIMRANGQGKLIDYKVFGRYGMKGSQAYAGKVTSALVHLNHPNSLASFNEVSTMEFAAGNSSSKWHYYNASNTSLTFHFITEEGLTYVKTFLPLQFYPNNAAANPSKSKRCDFFPDEEKGVQIQEVNNTGVALLQCSGKDTASPFTYKISANHSGNLISKNPAPTLSVLDANAKTVFSQPLSSRKSGWFKQKKFEYTPQFPLVQFKVDWDYNLKKIAGTATIQHLITAGSMVGQTEAKLITATISCQAK